MAWKNIFDVSECEIRVYTSGEAVQLVPESEYARRGITVSKSAGGVITFEVYIETDTDYHIYVVPARTISSAVRITVDAGIGDFWKIDAVTTAMGDRDYKYIRTDEWEDIFIGGGPVVIVDTDWRCAGVAYSLYTPR